jgi:putative DNA primase/helicase
MCERLIVIPFERRFRAEEKDPRIFEKIIKEELPGVLNRALQGYRRLRRRGRFTCPSDISNAKANLIKKANPVAAFVDEHCERRVGKCARLQELHKSFAIFLKEADAAPRSTRNLSQGLENLGFRRKKISTGIIHLGLRLRQRMS